MKKISIIVLSLLLVCAFFSSCENNVASVDSKVAAVNFSVADGRGLQELKPDFIPVNDESLVWYYKADKTSDSNFKTGAASVWTRIGDDGKLTNNVIFSLGIWNIDLQARLADGTIMYEGSKVGIIIDDPNNTTTVSINVSASVSGQNGYIVLDDVYILEQDGTGKVAPNVLIVSVSGAVSGTSYNLTDNENGTVDSDPISLAPGSYDVAVGYISGSIKNAGEIKTVQVYSGRTTTVTGYVDEMRGVVQFNPVADTGVAYPNAPVTGGSSTTFTVVNVTPSGETAKSTKAVFEDGALSIGGDYKLSTIVSNEIEKGDFDISTGSNTVASLDLSLTNGTEVVSTFNNKTVTITTYIAKGLSGVTVKGPAGATITGVNYDSSTGMLEFTTNHFSEYLIKTEDDIVAYNKSSKKAYLNIEVALSDADEGDIVVLIKSITRSKYLEIKKGLTFDGNGNSIVIDSNGKSIDRRGIVISSGDIVVTIKDLTVDVRNNVTSGADYPRGINVYNENGIENLVLNIDGCNIYARHYALNLTAICNNIEVNVVNSTLLGYAAINEWATDSEINVKDSSLYGINESMSGSNDFATVCAESDTTHVIDDASINTVINIDRSKIYIAKKEGGNRQDHIKFNSSNSKSNIVRIDGETNFYEGFTISPESEIVYVEAESLSWQDNGIENKLFVNNELVNEPVEANIWYSNNPFSPDKNVEGSMNTNIYKPFDSKWMYNGEGLVLIKDVILTRDIVCELSTGTVYFYFDSFSISGGVLKIKDGVTIVSDKNGLENTFVVSDTGKTVYVDENENGTYSYRVDGE